MDIVNIVKLVDENLNMFLGFTKMEQIILDLGAATF